MASIVRMSTRDGDGCENYYYSVDTAAIVAQHWAWAFENEHMIPLRNASFKGLPDDSGTVHSGSPREVDSVELIFINPIHVEAVVDQSEPSREAAAVWRKENDTSQIVLDHTGMLPKNFPISEPA